MDFFVIPRAEGCEAWARDQGNATKRYAACPEPFGKTKGKGKGLLIHRPKNGTPKNWYRCGRCPHHSITRI